MSKIHTDNTVARITPQKRVRRHSRQSDSYIREAVRLSYDIGVAQTAKDLGIVPGTLYYWRRNMTKKTQTPQTEQTPEEMKKRIEQLEKENGYLKKITDVLKKNVSIFSKDLI